MSLTFSMKISSFIDMQNVRFHFDLVPFAKQNKLFWFVLVYFLMRLYHLFQSKTSCFGIMKAYEGKNFAFISITQ